MYKNVKLKKIYIYMLFLIKCVYTAYNLNLKNKIKIINILL